MHPEPTHRRGRLPCWHSLGRKAGSAFPDTCATARPPRPRHRTCGAAIAASALLGVLGSTAQAAPTLYTSPALFAAAAGRLQGDSFNDLPAGVQAAPLQRTAGSLSYSVAVDPDTSGLGAGSPVPPGEVFGAGSATDAWLSTNTATDTLRFFNLGSIKALGGQFFGSDVDGQFLPGVAIDLVATDSGGTFSHTLSAATLNSFLGFVSDTGLLSLSLRAAQPPLGSAWVSANNLQVGATVPEPGSAALALLALAGLALVRRPRPTGAAR